MSALSEAILALDDAAVRRFESRVKGINAQLRDFNGEIQSWRNHASQTYPLFSGQPRQTCQGHDE